MSLANLFLWMLLVEPWSMVCGAIAAVIAYRVAHPRPRTHCGELLVEGWRIYALLASIPAFLFGAELSLWAGLLDYRAPLVFTGLIDALGITLLALAPSAVVVAFCSDRPVRGRPAAITTAVLAIGLALFLGGRQLRHGAWTALAAEAPTNRESLYELITLTSYLYLADGQARDALDQSLPAAGDIASLVQSARDTGEPALAGWFVKPYLATRLSEALAAASPAAAAESRGDAIPAIWWLTNQSQPTLRAYALTVPELRTGALADDGPDVNAVMTHALTSADEPVVGALVQALHALRARAPLDQALIDALASHLDDADPAGSLVLAILLQEASVASLRPILPRFADESGPAWQVLRSSSNCPKRTNGLNVLVGDADPAVAAGAGAVLGHVRQWCIRWRPVR